SITCHIVTSLVSPRTMSGTTPFERKENMRIKQNHIPTVMEVPGSTARQIPAGGSFAAEYFSLAAGTDIAPLLQGLEGDACQAAHWGYMVARAVVVTYADGPTEQSSAQDLFHWPPGHSVRVVDDAEVILFSPQDSHGQ